MYVLKVLIFSALQFVTMSPDGVKYRFPGILFLK